MIRIDLLRVRRIRWGVMNDLPENVPDGPSMQSPQEAKEAADGSLCQRCTALCCRYLALQIDEPESPEQFDDVRWYLLHEQVHVFVEDGGWYLSIQTPCEHLQPDNRCGIYEDRPKICREYTTDACEYHLGNEGYEQYFTQAVQLEAYASATLGQQWTDYVYRQRLANDPDQARSAKSKTGRAKAKPRPSHVLKARLQRSARVSLPLLMPGKGSSPSSGG
jgi:Fe-S-cluster containining protein